MKIRYYSIGLFYLIYFANTVDAYSSTNFTYLTSQIKPNPITRSKPTSNFIKLASVQFLGGARKELNYGCPEGQGWSITEDGCVVNPCDGYHYVAGSPELAMCDIGADGKPVVDSCLSGTSQRLRCRSCKPPSDFNDDKECVCDRSTYVTDTCPDNTVAITPDDFCTEISSTGVETTYYKGCDCPEDWEVCTSNQVGSGTGCKTSEGQIMYSSCRCEDRFSETCTEIGVEPAGEKCSDSRGTRYTACVSCDITKGTVAKKDEYWCNSDHTGHIKWNDIGFKPMSASIVKCLE